MRAVDQSPAVDANETLLDELARRLDHGWTLIDRAAADGDNAEVVRLTAFWLMLLREYESKYDEMRES